MEKIRVAINGFGRIGRISLRELLKRPNVEVVAINDLTDHNTLAYLFKHDSVHRAYPGTVEVADKGIVIDGKVIHTYASKDPAGLPWKELNIDVVIEATGVFRDRAGASKHLEAGARKVVISAPPKGDDIKSIVLGVNEDNMDGSEDILSNASCTTNCTAPMVKILDDNWGIENAYLTTIHAYTADQRLQDAPHSDLRRARAAAVSIVPTSTGAATAVAKILPHLQGKLQGGAMRVPVPDGSITDLTVLLKTEASVEEINAAFRAASAGAMEGILEYSDTPLVSVDILSNPHSCIFDSQLTTSMGKLVKIVGWYDNEYGYSSRVADLVEKMAAIPVSA